MIQWKKGLSAYKKTCKITCTHIHSLLFPEICIVVSKIQWHCRLRSAHSHPSPHCRLTSHVCAGALLSCTPLARFVPEGVTPVTWSKTHECSRCLMQCSGPTVTPECTTQCSQWLPSTVDWRTHIAMRLACFFLFCFLYTMDCVLGPTEFWASSFCAHSSSPTASAHVCPLDFCNLKHLQPFKGPFSPNVYTPVKWPQRIHAPKFMNPLIRSVKSLTGALM